MEPGLYFLSRCPLCGNKTDEDEIIKFIDDTVSNLSTCILTSHDITVFGYDDLNEVRRLVDLGRKYEEYLKYIEA